MRTLAKKIGLCIAYLFAMALANFSKVSHASESIHVVVGVPSGLTEIAMQGIEDSFSDIDYALYSENSPEHIADIQESSIGIGVGNRGCQLVIESAAKKIVCTLLSKKSAVGLFQEDGRCSAIVVDQPLDRQINVAKSIYPSLRKFAVLLSDEGVLPNKINGSAVATPYRSDIPLVKQIKSAISNSDALLAMPDAEIYRRDTLRSVLLTTYGYAKPVIGYSRAYVDAGALITAWSSPAQLLRQIAEDLSQSDEDAPTGIISPRYFSVYGNESIARSLDLIPVVVIDPGRTLVDGDFP